MSNSKLIYAVWFDAMGDRGPGGTMRYAGVLALLKRYLKIAGRKLPENPLAGGTNRGIHSGAFRPKQALDSIEKDLMEQDAQLHLREDEGYPAILREIADPPPILYVRGNLSFEGLRMLAMVGTRHPCPRYGRDMAYRLAQWENRGSRWFPVLPGGAYTAPCWSPCGRRDPPLRC